MFTFLKKGFGGSKKGIKSRPAPARRSVRLGLESLEHREVLSGFGAGADLAQTAFQAQAAQGLTQTLDNEIKVITQLVQNYIHQFQELVYDFTHQVPNLAGVNFAMTNQSGGHYSVQIQQQIDQFGDTASFTGVWGAGSANGGKPVTGTLAGNMDGTLSIRFDWTGPNTGHPNDHHFVGTISGTPGAYQIVGDVTVDGGGGPGHLTGHQV